MKSAKSKKGPRNPRITLDKDSRKGAKQAETSDGRSKKGRGRPPKISRDWVTGRAYDNSIKIGQVWSKLEAPLLACQTEEKIIAAFKLYAEPYAQSFVPHLARDILILIRDKKFPKRAKARISFLANSLAGRPDLSLRSSRDICEKHRAERKRKSRHQILRHEFYIECSCGYKGPALDNSCRNCHAGISFSLEELGVTGTRLFPRR